MYPGSQAPLSKTRQIGSDLGWPICESHSDLIRVRGGGVAESEENPIRVVTMAKRVLAELDALGNGSAD